MEIVDDGGPNGKKYRFSHQSVVPVERIQVQTSGGVYFSPQPPSDEDYQNKTKEMKKLGMDPQRDSPCAALINETDSVLDANVVLLPQPTQPNAGLLQALAVEKMSHFALQTTPLRKLESISRMKLSGADWQSWPSTFSCLIQFRGNFLMAFDCLPRTHPSC